MFTDPDGMEAKGFEYSNGYSTQDSRNETGAVSHEGAFLNAEGGGNEEQATTQVNIEQGDKPKNRNTSTIPTVAQHRQGNQLRPGGDGIEVAIL